MQTLRLATSRRISLTVLVVALVALSGCVRATGAPADSDRAAQAWADRLNGQAQDVARREQAQAAYTLRLIGQARAYQAQQARERGNQAWTDRLNGLAERANPDQ